MATDVKLILTADNSQYISKVREAQKASQNLHNYTEQGMKREKELIIGLEQELTRLQTLKKNTWIVADIEKYNQKLTAAKDRLKEYETVGVEANENIEKSASGLKAIYVGLGVAIGAVAGAFRVLKEAVLQTETGFNRFNVVAAVTKQLIYDIVNRTDWKSWRENLEKAAAIQTVLNNLRIEERDILIQSKAHQIVYNKYLTEAKDQTKTLTERVKNYDLALLAHNKMIDIENNFNEKKLLTVRELLKIQPDSQRLLDEEAALILVLLDVENKRWASQKEISSMRTGLIKSMTDAERKIYENARKEEYKKTEEYYLGMRNLFFDYIDDINKAKEEQWKSDGTTADLLYKANRRRAKELWDKMLEDEKKIQDLEKYSIEQRKENLRSFADTAQSFINTLSEISNAQVEKLQFDRQVLDTRISEAQSALETEAELYEAGYASNVTAKQKELNELKKQRDQALREEEEARKKSHRIAIAALLAEKAASVAQIIINTKIANVKALAASPLTFGLPWVAYNNVTAALSIAALTAAFALAATSKYAKGGWTGNGGQRDETGERMAGIVHENEFVVKKGPAHRFRDVLEAINKEDKAGIFNSFNKLSPELIGGTSINNVMVENSGPNKRLDRINTQLSQLNTKLTTKQINNEMVNMNNMTIYKRGDVTRIIRR